MTALLQTTLATLIGSVLMINGIMVNTDDILNETKTAVNGANIHQIATVLEIYYMNHGEYPDVVGGGNLIDTFETEGYILNRPSDANAFNYESKDNAQNYKLELK